MSSRSLSDIECKYSQIEKECLAIVWGCEKFHLYVYRRPFTITSDNKALEYIFKRSNGKVPIRIEHWTVRLFDYDFKVKHRPGIGNPADFLSRHPIPAENSEKINEIDINYMFSVAVPKSINRDELAKATNDDCILQEVIRRIKGAKISQEKRKSKQFDVCFHELSVTADGIVMRNHLIVIPLSLQNKSIELAHDGHQGVSKTKDLLIASVWFPRMNVLVEEKLNQCKVCRINHPKRDFEPLHMSIMPDGPWEILMLDFFGPTPCRSELLVLYDSYSRFPIVHEVQTNSNFCTILHVTKRGQCLAYQK